MHWVTVIQTSALAADLEVAHDSAAVLSAVVWESLQVNLPNLDCISEKSPVTGLYPVPDAVHSLLTQGTMRSHSSVPAGTMKELYRQLQLPTTIVCQ